MSDTEQKTLPEELNELKRGLRMMHQEIQSLEKLIQEIGKRVNELIYQHNWEHHNNDTVEEIKPIHECMDLDLASMAANPDDT